MEDNYYALLLAIVKEYSQSKAFEAVRQKKAERKHRKKEMKYEQEELDLEILQVDVPA